MNFTALGRCLAILLLTRNSFFLSATHLEALQHLRYGIEEKKGFIVLTGEVGCGKTTLCRKLLEELDALNNHLLSLIEQGKDVVLIIDDPRPMVATLHSC